MLLTMPKEGRLCVVSKSRLCKTRGALSTRIELAPAVQSGAEDLEEEEQDQTPGNSHLSKAILFASAEESQVFKRAIAQRTAQQPVIPMPWRCCVH